jgi:hypothetical protein
MKGAVDFMPAELQKSVQGKARKVSWLEAGHATIFDENFVRAWPHDLAARKTLSATREGCGQGNT